MNIDVKNVLNVVYPKHKNDSIGYDAIGICRITLDKADPQNNEKCAFSQFRLGDCDSIGCIIYSICDANGNQWYPLCGQQSQHLFDVDYLRTWIQLKGCEYIQCPLCKTGITEQKEHIEEHDIDSMEQLVERRLESKKENDLNMTYHIEQLILDKACSSHWDRHQNENKILYNQDILRQVLNHWISKKKMDEFRDKIIQSTNKCISNDNYQILKILLKYCGYDNTKAHNNSTIILFINTAARFAAFDCIKILLKYPKKLDWGGEKRPIVLLNAVKFHPENIEIIKFVMQQLEMLKISFVCDDVMEQVIKFDLVEIAKRIVNNRWHKINEKDEKFAKHINLNCFLFFEERSNAFNFNKNQMNCNDEDGLNWDDDDWGADEEKNDNFNDADGFDEDDDWQNADD